MPSILCYRQTAVDQWKEHFCLVNPECRLATEDEASSIATADLNAAFQTKNEGGSDGDFALVLRNKGYVNVEGYRRAIDPDPEVLNPIPE